MSRKSFTFLLALLMLLPPVQGDENDPDLTIEDISFSDDSPAGGDEIMITAEVANDGGATGLQSVTANVTFYWDNNSIGQDMVTIPGGQSADASVEWTAVGGTHNITAIVDEENDVQESNEDNNQRSEYITVTYPSIAVIDDDGGENNGGTRVDVDGYYTDALDSLELTYDLLRVDSGDDGPDADTLTNYGLVIWFVGSDLSTTFTQNDQDAMAQFLDDGGTAWVTGHDILWDLNTATGSRSEGDWEYDYLGVGYVDHDNGTANPVGGVQDDPVTDGAKYDTDDSLFFDYGDDLAPRSDFHGIFNTTDDDGTLWSALRTEEGYGMVFLAFEFAYIASTDNRTDLVDRIVEYLLEELEHDVSLSRFNSPRDGDTIEPDVTQVINVTVRNRGSEDESNVQVNLDIDCRNSSANDHSDSKTISSLPAGATTTVTFDWDVPEEEDYVYDIEAEAYISSDEKRTNDKRSITVDTYVLHNLALEAARATPRLGEPDEERTLSVKVENSGDVTLTRDVRGLVFEGDEELWDGGTQEVTLGPGENTTLEWDWTPNGYGTFTFRAQLEQEDEDSNDDVAAGELRAVNIEFRDSFESGRNGWSDYRPISNAWHLIDTDNDENREAYSPTHSLWVGDEGKGDGEYDDNWDYSVFTDQDITLGAGSELVIQHWYSMESSWDGGNVQITTDGGESWTVIHPNGGYPDDAVVGLDNQPGFTGSSDDWEEARFDLVDFSGEDVRFRFRFGSDSSVNSYEGWYLDDIEVSGSDGTFSDDLEDGDGNWNFSGENSEWSLDDARAVSGSHAWRLGNPETGTYSPGLNDSLESPTIDLGDGSEKGVAIMAWFAVDGPYDEFYLEINVSGEWEMLESGPGDDGDYSSDYDEADGEGWLYLESDLSDYSDEVTLRLRFISDTWTQLEGLYVDDFTVFSLPQLQDDVGVRDIDAPDEAGPGEAVDFSGDVYNFGANDQTNVDVRATVTRDGDGSEVYNQSRTIAQLDSGENATLDWTWQGGDNGSYTIRVQSLLDDDERPGNDASEQVIDIRESAWAVALAVEEAVKDVLSGEATFFNFTATNEGDEGGYYDVAAAGSGDGWYAIPLEEVIYISAGGSTDFTVTVIAPTQEPTGASRDFTVSVTSQNDAAARDSEEITGTADYREGTDGDSVLLVDANFGHNNGYNHYYQTDEIDRRLKLALQDYFGEGEARGYDVHTLPYDSSAGDYGELDPYPTVELLTQYDIVVWTQGEHHQRDLDAWRDTIGGYLDSGDGGLWLIGSNYLTALNSSDGYREPGDFEYDYLMVERIDNDRETPDPLVGASNDEVFDGAEFSSSDRTIYSSSYSDWVIPRSIATGGIYADAGSWWHVSDNSEATGDPEREASSPTHALWVGDGDKDTGEYDDNWDEVLLTRDSYELGEDGQLNFQNWYSTENGYDGGNVQISTDGGGTWEVINPAEEYSDDSVIGLDNEPGYTGSSDGWVSASFSLSEYANEEVTFKFRFGSDSSASSYEGWYIDDVELQDASGVLFSDDLESGGDNWVFGASSGYNLTLRYEGDYQLMLSPFTFAFLDDERERSDIVERVLDWLFAAAAAHDVGTRLLDVPSEGDENTTVEFSSTIRNYGSEDQSSFTVRAQALLDGDVIWSDTQTVGFLAAGDEVELTWSWEDGGPTGEYVIGVETELAGDENTNNDRREADFEAVMLHAPAVSTVSDSKEGEPGQTLTFKVTLRNDATGRDKLSLSLSGTAADWAELQISAVTLESDDERDIDIDVELPEDAADGEYSLMVEVTAGDVTVTQELTATVTEDPTEYGVTLELEPQFIDLIAGQSADFSVTVANTGDDSDTFDLEALGDRPEWVSFAASQVSLAAGESIEIDGMLSVPDDVLDDRYELSVRAVSQGDDSANDEQALTVDVIERQHDLQFRLVTGELTRVTVAPGETASFNFSLENRGNSADTFSISFDDAAADWATAVPAQVTLEPEDETTITVTITVPTGAALAEYRVGIIATADDGQTDQRRTLTLEVEVPVTETHSLELCFTMPSGDCLSQRALEVAVEQGEIQTGAYGFRVTNNGNSDAEISLTLTLPSGSTDWQASFTDGGGNRWYVRLDPDTADYPLQLMPGGQMDWGALVINNHKLAAGGSYAFTLTAEVVGQPGTAQQLSVTVTVTEPDAPPPTDEEGGGLPAPSLLAVLLLLGGVALRRRR